MNECRRILSFLLVPIICTGILLLQCGVTGIAGSEVKNEFAVLYMQDGRTPAAGALVQIVPVAYVPGEGREMIYTTTTNREGGYATSGVRSGTYNILASLGELASYNDSVYIDENTLPADDTLAVTGCLPVAVKQQPNHTLLYTHFAFLPSANWYYERRVTPDWLWRRAALARSIHGARARASRAPWRRGRAWPP